MLRLTLFASILGSLLLLFPQPSAPPNYETLDALLWMQTAVEYRAAAEQTYRVAEHALLRGLHDDHWTAALEQSGDFEKLPPAVVLDLDETVLDNSAFAAQAIESGEPYTLQMWNEWMKQERAGLVPGALEFLMFAHVHGVTPIYITNRTCDSSSQTDPTVDMLHKLQIPLDPPAGHLFCATAETGSDKTSRRAAVAGNYRILLLFGDQLGDFLQVPKSFSDLPGREKLFEAHRELWGTRWFQLPNPVYGSWMDPLGSTIPEKLSHLRK
jgi:5'-nucleotidase (lipoprotein e(P4) family)